jgi:hypothetical protein
MLRRDLTELIERMTRKENYLNSDDSVSWHAHREAEQLSEQTMVGELAQYVIHEPNYEKRHAVDF